MQKECLTDMKILLSKDELHDGVMRMADEIAACYENRQLTIVGVLTGSVVLMADLIRAIDLPMRVGVLQASSYSTTTKDAGHDVTRETRVTMQTLPMGPAASQVAIKMLGTNGGGFFNANSAHPYENPTPFSNFIEMLAIFTAAAVTYSLSRVCLLTVVSAPNRSVEDPYDAWKYPQMSMMTGSASVAT